MLRGLAAFLLCALIHGCSDRGDAREWRPSDHDQPDEQTQVPGDTDYDEASRLLYRQHCASCHGMDGTGHTPVAKQMPVRNLQRSTMSEREVAQVIVKGRNRMPAFGRTLDEEAVRALTKLVMTLRR